jgi:hypothetical protein
LGQRRGCVAISLHHYVDYKKRLKVKETPNPEVGKAMLFTLKRAWGSSSLIRRDFLEYKITNGIHKKLAQRVVQISKTDPRHNYTNVNTKYVSTMRICAFNNDNKFCQKTSAQGPRLVGGSKPLGIEVFPKCFIFVFESL